MNFFFFELSFIMLIAVKSNFLKIYPATPYDYSFKLFRSYSFVFPDSIKVYLRSHENLIEFLLNLENSQFPW